MSYIDLIKLNNFFPLEIRKSRRRKIYHLNGFIAEPPEFDPVPTFVGELSLDGAAYHGSSKSVVVGLLVAFIESFAGDSGSIT